MNGFSGFANLGNTCYINSALFILTHIDCFNFYIMDKKTETLLLNEWKELYYLYWRQNCIISPNKFINSNRKLFITNNKNEFLENQQCDSIEYFLFFIETLHKELNQEEFFNTFFDIQCNIKYLDETKEKVYFEKTQKHWILSLNIPPQNTTIEECIKYTFQEEYIFGDNAWHDEKDNQKKNVYIQTFISIFPKILILQIKRWNSVGNKLRHIIHISEYLEFSNSDKKYELFGMIHHHGSTNQGGHYFSSLKKYNKWYCFNDTTIQEISFEKLINETIYCLFYKKIK